MYRHERDDGDHRFSRYSESSESGEAANRTEIISPANEQYENRSKLLRYHYKQEPLRMQRSGMQAANAAAGSAACCLSGARAPAYCLLAADIICRNLKDLLLRLLSLHKECAVREDSALSF